MFKDKLKVIIFIFIVLPNLLVAQINISTEVLSVRHGLSNDNIVDIIQDQYGYMWFATLDGINMYDGYENTVFKNIPGDSTSLPHNRIFRLFEDSQGTIWTTTENGLARYDRNSSTFKTFKYSELDAESSNRVIDIFEDSRNILWVSSLKGTYEFDRVKERFKEFDIIKTDNDITKFLGYSGVITENKAGELYNLSWSFGLLKFDYDGSIFVQLDLKDGFNDYLKSKVYFDTEFDSNNNLWIGSSDGVAKINLSEMTGVDITPFKKVSNPINWQTNGATGFFLDRNNKLWVTTGKHGIYQFDMSKQKFEKFLDNTSTYFTGLYEDNSGLLWIGSSRGVLKYDFDRKPFELYTLGSDLDENNDNRVFSFGHNSPDKDVVLIGTPEGIQLFDRNTQSISRKAGVLSELNKFNIAALIEKGDGGLWIATDNNGLWSYNSGSSNLKNFTNKLYDNTSLRNNQIRSLALDNDENLWIGTVRGLQILKKNANNFSNVHSEINKNYNANLIAALEDLRKNATPISSNIGVGDYADLTRDFVVREDVKVLIYALGEGLPLVNMVDFGWLESENGDTLWSGIQFDSTFHAGGDFKNRIKIGVFDLKAGRYKLRYVSDDSHSAQAFNRIPPPDSSYWGIQIYPLSEDMFETPSRGLKNSEDKTYLTGEDIRIVFCDSNGSIWVGTNDGISKIDSNMFVENYFNISSDNSSLSNNQVRDIKEDHNGNIWIATSNGLNKFNRSEKTFSRIYERDGLPSANLAAIEIDKQGNLWVSGLNGISKIELDENGNKQIIVNYDVKDGLQSYGFIHRSSFIDESGKLYFGGQDGFNAFYPGSSNRTPPSLVIQDIKFSNKSINDIEKFDNPDLNQLSEMSLAHDQNDISFEFASIHFSRPDKNRILYKMDGVDEDWVNGERRIASYTNLSPGDYVFNLRGSNGDGVWNKETKKINIHIAAPWYNNWTAYIIYAFAFFGFLFSVRKFEMARQKKNIQIKESQLKIESAEALAKAAESEKHALQVEFEHKKKELDEARELQLSMLPESLPKLPHLDIAVYMRTATEVGGDYYDFHVSLDGTLTVVLGDATGHGMKAGTMVTAVKGLFNSYSSNPDILYSFHEISRCIKQMRLGKLSMCMTMLKINKDKMIMSAAGMPPIMIYKSNDSITSEEMIKGMPLGTFDNYPYDVREMKLSKGDTILLMSDGLPELTNSDDEQFGYQKVRNELENNAAKTPEQIIDQLKKAGEDWNQGREPDDDITFVVIKVK